jgi:hypothetical protein
MAAQKVDLYQPIVAAKVGPAPLALRIGVTANNDSVAGGMPMSNLKVETYVLLSALPEELRRRVDLAIQALITGM